MKEESRLGTAGGLRKFRKQILEGNPEHVILMHCDIFCTFPMREMMDFHSTHGKECTILGKQVEIEYFIFVIERTGS